MPTLPADRGLRRAVAQLQDMEAEDFDAVIGSLDAGQRKRVLSLLDQMRGALMEPVALPGVGAMDRICLPADLSPWLVARINGGQEDTPGAERFTMTEHAHQALRGCAASLLPQPYRKIGAESLLARIGQLFGMGRPCQ